MGGQGPGQFIVGEADGFLDVAQAVFGEDAVFGLTEDQADGGGVLRVSQQVIIDGGAVEVHLAGMLGLEVALHQLDHHEATKLQVVEEQIEVEFSVADFEPVLTAGEGEAAPQFGQELFQVA